MLSQKDPEKNMVHKMIGIHTIHIHYPFIMNHAVSLMISSPSAKKQISFERGPQQSALY